MNNFKLRVLRKEPNNTVVQECASRSTEFASVGVLNLHLDKKIVGENRGEM